jgi:putative ATP-dependent endonuclease of OLD family
MFIKKLLIRNYRCFGDAPTVIEFSESGLTALIGPNNVGKSTVLKALDILLGDKWPNSQFNEDDFHDNVLNKEIILACEFVTPIEVDVYGEMKKINGIVIYAKHISSGYGEASVETEYFMIDTIADFKTCSWNIVKSKYGKEHRISQGMKNSLPLTITIPLIKLHSEQPTNKWGVLGRMLQKIERIFVELDSGNKEKEFKGKIKEAVGILRIPDEFKQIEKDIKIFWDLIRPANISDTELDFLDCEPWRYYRQFKLAITRHGKEVPIDTLGEGVQRLAIIALYRTYLKHHKRNEKAILLVEEPESYLHPQARKTLFQVLKKALGDQKEGQIIYTTHSEDFIDCGEFEDIDIFWESNTNIAARYINKERLINHAVALGQVASSLSDPMIHYRLMETTTVGLKEALFSSKAIIVEGPTEVELFRFFSDADKNQIAIVCANGKDNIPSVYTFLTAFGIPCLIAIDSDEEEDKKGENKKITDLLCQINAKDSDSAKVEISPSNVNSVEVGNLSWIRSLLVFGGNVEKALSKIIPSYNNIISEIKKKFKLPKDSKPRNMQALGLIYSGIVDISGEQDAVLRALFLKSKPELNGLSKALNEFICQKVARPTLLFPKTA